MPNMTRIIVLRACTPLFCGMSIRRNFYILKNSTLLLCAVCCFAACKKKAEQIQPTVQRITESVYASGMIKSKDQYQVYATVAGIVQQIKVKEGDLVKKGDVLFVIHNETSVLNAQNAQIAADFAQWNTQGDRLATLKNAIDLAQSKVANDSLLVERQRGLWAQQIGSKVELEQRELALLASKNNNSAAVLAYRDLQKQLKFAAAQSQKQLAISKNTAQDYVVRSQTDGRVYSVDKEVGEIVNPQTSVAVIGKADDFETELQIDENDIVQVRLGQQVFLTLDSYKGQVFEAVVTKIDPLMHERTRTFTVNADFVKKPPVLYPNLTTEANILLSTKENALTIPRSFLLNDSTVMLANKTIQTVKIGLKDYQKVEILSGLTAQATILKPAK